jgi:hypothetical protein
MASTGLPQPGVEVIQVFRTVSPTVITPTLVPCIVGACKQVVDAVVPSATGGNQVNPVAQIELPAFFVAKNPTGSPAVYTFTGSRNLIFNSNGLPPVTVNFIAGTYTSNQVVGIVQTALLAAGESNLLVEVFGASWRMRTTSETNFDYIQIASTTSAEVFTQFGLYSLENFQGTGSYTQDQVTVPPSSFPDPNNNNAQLSFDTTTVRGFVGISGNTQLQEALRTATLLRHGGATTVIDSGNGSGFSNIIQAAGEDFTSTSTAATAATVTGSAAPTFGSLNGKTVVVSDGRQPVTVTFGVCAVIGDVVSQWNAFFNATDGIVASAAGTDLVLTSNRKREDGTTAALGEDSTIALLSGSALYPTNLLDPGGTPNIKIGRFTGLPMAAFPGDLLYIDGVLAGTISQVAPNGQNAQLRVNTNKALAFTGSHFYIVAQNIGPLPGETANRPRPDFIVDANGQATFKHGLLRDSNGAISESVQTTALIEPASNLYISYKALRLDVTNKAVNPGLLQFSDPTTLATELSPITADNPLGLGLYFALLNAPAVQITGLGVDAVTPSEPFGTVAAFTDAASFLEQFEVYSIAPLTHETAVHQVFQTHVDSMSLPENKGERIVLVNPSKPVTRLNALVASGTNGNTLGSGGLTFDTGISNLTALLIAAGIPTPSSIPVSLGVFLNISDNALNYNVTAVSGSVVTVNITFTGSQNTDSFYSTTDLKTPPLPAQLIEDPFSIKVRGAPLVLTDGITPDKPNIAATYTQMAQSFLDRRVWMVVPDQCAATLSGVEQIIDGFYMCAAIAGMIGQQPPQQSFTNFPMTGFTRVIGSNDFFTPQQMNQMAGGGAYIILQDVKGVSPLYARMALTTDLTSIETRTDSITKVVDFCAKFYRTGLKNFIGRFNINQGLLDSLGHVLQGLTGFLTEAGVLIGAHVNNLLQDTSAPDTVLVDITLDVPFPCNYIRITLVI